jgi:hypothetical protein
MKKVIYEKFRSDSDHQIYKKLAFSRIMALFSDSILPSFGMFHSLTMFTKPLSNKYIYFYNNIYLKYNIILVFMPAFLIDTKSIHNNCITFHSKATHVKSMFFNTLIEMEHYIKKCQKTHFIFVYNVYEQSTGYILRFHAEKKTIFKRRKEIIITKAI